MPLATSSEVGCSARWISAGAIFARQIAGGRTATVAVDAMVFRKPVHVGDVMCLHADFLRIGTTSITVRVEAWVIRNSESGVCSSPRGHSPPSRWTTSEGLARSSDIKASDVAMRPAGRGQLDSLYFDYPRFEPRTVSEHSDSGARARVAIVGGLGHRPRRRGQRGALPDEGRHVPGAAPGRCDRGQLDAWRPRSSTWKTQAKRDKSRTSTAVCDARRLCSASIWVRRRRRSEWMAAADSDRKIVAICSGHK